MGTISHNDLVSWAEMSTSRGKTSLNAGINNTSSNVRPSPKKRDALEVLDLLPAVLPVPEVEFIAMGKDNNTLSIL
jgi:hypothetical protein